MAGLNGEAEGTGTSGEDLLPNAALPFELQNHRRGAVNRVGLLDHMCMFCKDLLHNTALLLSCTTTGAAPRLHSSTCMSMHLRPSLLLSLHCI